MGTDKPYKSSTASNKKYGKIKLMSFGFKCGSPAANYYFDVSFAVNPARQERWGMFGSIDQEMIKFVLEQREVKEFIDLLTPLIEHIASLDSYQIIAFGCSSGRHRSPIIVNEIAARLMHEIPLEVIHRDLPENEAFSYTISHQGMRPERRRVP